MRKRRSFRKLWRLSALTRPFTLPCRRSGGKIWSLINSSIFLASLSLEPWGRKLRSQEAKELALALWVIDSNMTNPSMEDVMRFTKAKNVKEAKKVIESELDKRKVRKVFEEIE